MFEFVSKSIDNIKTEAAKGTEAAIVAILEVVFWVCLDLLTTGGLGIIFGVSIMALIVAMSIEFEAMMKE